MMLDIAHALILIATLYFTGVSLHHSRIDSRFAGTMPFILAVSTVMDLLLADEAPLPMVTLSFCTIILGAIALTNGYWPPMSAQHVCESADNDYRRSLDEY